jgi:hypothetical protein
MFISIFGCTFFAFPKIYLSYRNIYKEKCPEKTKLYDTNFGRTRNFNRISFGDSLWTSIIRPSIAHGCAVWFPSTISSAQDIESLQYQAGKIILKTKMSFPKSALLSEFGWEPINEFLDLIILQDFMNFQLTGYAKLYSWS